MGRKGWDITALLSHAGEKGEGMEKSQSEIMGMKRKGWHDCTDKWRFTVHKVYSLFSQKNGEYMLRCEIKSNMYVQWNCRQSMWEVYWRKIEWETQMKGLNNNIPAFPWVQFMTLLIYDCRDPGDGDKEKERWVVTTASSTVHKTKARVAGRSLWRGNSDGPNAISARCNSCNTWQFNMYDFI